MAYNNLSYKFGPTAERSKTMPSLFQAADAWCRQSDWKDLALVKFCLFSMGVLVALRLPRRALPAARKWARRVFVLSYVPLMAKFLPMLDEARR